MASEELAEASSETAREVELDGGGGGVSVASMELEGPSSETVREVEVDGGGGSNEIKVREKIGKEKTKKKDKKMRPKFGFGCLRVENDKEENFDMEVVDRDGKRLAPALTHLVITVNGIIGSPEDWRYAAKQMLGKYPEDVIVHCSLCNSAMLTFDGVDVMGARLAEEVISVIKHHPGVQKISFIGHSLGGLIARYTIAKLYGRDVTREFSEANGECKIDGSRDPSLEEKFKGKIAGLEPMNFITFATPHLGLRGHKQVPVFFGFHTLEKIASHAS